MSALMKILYGPPGTGKTWLAAREAVKAVDPEAYNKTMKEKGDGGIQDLHKKLVIDGRIIWVTFHPSYSYEDFVEGYRPSTDDDGKICYIIKDGPFKELCKVARGERVDLKIGEDLSTEKGQYYGTVVDKDSSGWIVEVTPGRKDQVAEKMDKYVDRYTIRKIKEKNLNPSVFSIPGKNIVDLKNLGINQLEDYKDSLGDLSDYEPDPELNEDDTHRKGSKARRIVGAITGISSSDLSNSAHYGAVYRRLNELEKNARPTNVALVIDEINRADLSRVFGELITILEPDKRENMPEERRVWLPYSKTLFSVPSTVSIIGTLNTVDKSISSMDFAMRRRFQFILVNPDSDLCPTDYGGLNLKKVLDVLNKRLDVLLGNDFRIGHSILMESKLEEFRQKNGWEDEDSYIRTVAATFRTIIIPLILEYFQNDWIKTRAVLTADKDDIDLSLFVAKSPDRCLVDCLPDEYDLEESLSYDLADWWSPYDDSWDKEKFLKFISSMTKWS